MVHPLTCGILAGGASVRMGRNKALLDFRGRTLLAHQIALLGPLFEHVWVGANDDAPYAPFGVRVVADLLPQRCALAGIHAILSAAPTDHSFLVACDMPMLNGRLIDYLVDQRQGYDVVVPESDVGLEPLHAVYSHRCIGAIEASARGGRWKVSDFYSAVRTRVVRVRDTQWSVQGHSPFLNANTPLEWEGTTPAG